MILTLNVKLVCGRHAEDGWQGVLEIDATATLDDLHQAIQRAVDFDNDHLYHFYLSRSERSRESARLYNLDEDDDFDADELPIENLNALFPLPKDKKLFYLFDYGDNWLFQVSLSRKKPFPCVVGTEYPRLVEAFGNKPQQYVDWDE